MMTGQLDDEAVFRIIPFAEKSDHPVIIEDRNAGHHSPDDLLSQLHAEGKRRLGIREFSMREMEARQVRRKNDEELMVFVTGSHVDDEARLIGLMNLPDEPSGKYAIQLGHDET